MIHIKIACQYCYSIHDKAYKCKAKSNHKRTLKADRDDERIYRSYTWRKLREQKVKDSHYCCEICLKLFYKNNTRVNTVAEGLEVHHIIPINHHKQLGLSLEDVAYNEQNLLTLCKVHHQTIHDKELYSIEDIEQYFGIKLENEDNLI